MSTRVTRWGLLPLFLGRFHSNFQGVNRYKMTRYGHDIMVSTPRIHLHTSFVATEELIVARFSILSGIWGRFLWANVSLTKSWQWEHKGFHSYRHPGNLSEIVQEIMTGELILAFDCSFCTKEKRHFSVHCSFFNLNFDQAWTTVPLTDYTLLYMFGKVINSPLNRAIIFENRSIRASTVHRKPMTCFFSVNRVYWKT
jgi:hypothetical protein